MGKVKGVEFGYFYRKDPNEPIVDYSNAKNFVYIEASAHACPQPQKTVKEYGAEWTLERYVSCDVVTRNLIWKTAERLNPELFAKLSTPVTRLSDEPVGIYEKDAVPESHQTEMSPGSTSYGYSASRVTIAAIGRDSEGRLAIIPERLPAIVDMVEDAVTNSHTPIELLVRLANGAVKLGADQSEVLSHMFAQGIIDEENCRTQYREIEKELERFSPSLWEIYFNMSSAQKKEKGMWIHE